MVDSKTLADGVVFTKYEYSEFAGKAYLLDVDMSVKGISLEACFADDVCPSPHYETVNNGKKVREVLSAACLRKRSEGRNVLAGVNGDYYETQPGILLSCHIQEGEPVFVNNPYELYKHNTFVHGLTVFEDGSLSTDARKISCSARFSGKEIPFYSVNDTIVRLSPKCVAEAQPYRSANLYTSRYRKQPFPSEPGLVNPIGTRALFVVAKSASALKVNQGYIPARVVAVYDGLNSVLEEAPYIDDPQQWVLQLTGTGAAAFEGVKTGDTVDIKVDVEIGGQTKAIHSHIGGIFRLVADDAYVPVHSSRTTEKKRATILGVSKDGRKAKLLCSDTKEMLYKDHAEVCRLLDLYNAVKIDGGGSTEMWLWDSRSGSIVCPSSDSNGPERSNMNYLMVCKN